MQLLESPIFSFLRLQLLDPGQHAGLVRTLYGLLMLLPQSTAFNTLRQRLDCVPPAVSVVQQGGKMSDRLEIIIIYPIISEGNPVHIYMCIYTHPMYIHHNDIRGTSSGVACTPVNYIQLLTNCIGMLL